MAKRVNPTANFTSVVRVQLKWPYDSPARQEFSQFLEKEEIYPEFILLAGPTDFVCLLMPEDAQRIEEWLKKNKRRKVRTGKK